MEHEANKTIIGEYKGKPIITLNPGDRFPFSFGVSKARLILSHLDEIRSFVEQHENKTATDPHE